MCRGNKVCPLPLKFARYANISLKFALKGRKLSVSDALKVLPWLKENLKLLKILIER